MMVITYLICSRVYDGNVKIQLVWGQNIFTHVK